MAYRKLLGKTDMAGSNYVVLSSFTGNRSRHEDEACRHHFFTGQETPQYLLADGNSIECPFHGKFVEQEQTKRVGRKGKLDALFGC